MQNNLASRQNRLAPLVLAECLEGNGRFIPAIAEVMESLVAMPSWTLSAHDAQLLNFHGARYYVDLNAAAGYRRGEFRRRAVAGLGLVSSSI